MNNPIDKLIHELAKLPGIGEKTALRLALYILKQPPAYGRELARALEETIGSVRFCQNCLNLTTDTLCEICRDPHRDAGLICVTENIADLKAIEKTHAYRGHYHVLHGTLSPLDGVGPGDLKIAELTKRVRGPQQIQEVILATNPNVTGDATALYLFKLLKPLGLRITKLASGIPVGGYLEFIDQTTLSRALETRTEFSS